MKILFAAPATNDRVTLFITNYFTGLANSAQELGCDVRFVSTSENMYNPLIPKSLTNQYQVFRKCFCSVVDSVHDWQLGTRLVREVEDFQPDVLLLHVFDTYSLSGYVEKIRQMGVKILFWLGVHPSHATSGVQSLLRAVSGVLYYDRSYEDYYRDKLNIRHVYRLPLGVALDNPPRSRETKYDVCFSGLFDSHRENYLKPLMEYNLAILSWNISEFDTPLLKCHQGEASGKKLYDIYKQSKIVLNIHRDFEVSGGNYRLFEICATGSFQMVDSRSGISEYFQPGHEIVTFDSPEDLRKKVAYYLEHDAEREAIALAGFNRVVSDHSLSNRMARIIEIAKEIPCNPV
jgi:spore maturation protein CgeB